MPKSDPAPKPPHTVTGDIFVWNSTDPEVGVVSIPLKFKMKILRAARDMQGDDLGFALYLFDALGVDVDEMDAAEAMSMFKTWQDAWTDRQGATFPEA